MQNLIEISNNQISVINIFQFIFNLLWSGILSLFLSWTYIKYGKSLSNRFQFSYNFFILTMTTMLIITIVKSSLALSLGLVGALSIIRFRTAIKEPEELLYIFLSISIGLGLGANQLLITTIAISIILLSIILYQYLINDKNINVSSIILVLENNNATKESLNFYIEVLNENCKNINLRRVDTQGKKIEASFIIELENFSFLKKIQKKLVNKEETISISYIENKGLFQ
jgi:hypothetical protein